MRASTRGEGSESHCIESMFGTAGPREAPAHLLLLEPMPAGLWQAPKCV